MKPEDQMRLKGMPMFLSVIMFARFVVKQGCIDCDRLCPRCHYEIPGGFEHIEHPQPPDSNVVVCSFKRVARPLAERVNAYLTHKAEHVERVEVEVAI